MKYEKVGKIKGLLKTNNTYKEVPEEELKGPKYDARTEIRNRKDIEDDLVDTKILLQFISYAIIDIYEALDDTTKSRLKFQTTLQAFTDILRDPANNFRVDVEPDTMGKIMKIVTDELEFAQIAKSKYLDKKGV